MIEWEPQDEDIEWTRSVIESMEINQDWMEGEMAFRKTGDTTLTLLTRTERAEGPAQRVKVVLEDYLDWVVDDSEVKVIPDDPAMAAQMMQQQAESWTCPECDEQRVVNMNLGKVEWKTEGQTYYIDETGERQPLDRWVVAVRCDCGKPVHLSPDDYFLVAGELNFYTWYIDIASNDTLFDGMTHHQIARVLNSEQIVNLVDSGDLEGLETAHLGTTYQNKTVPPHMRGTFCHIFEMAMDEEE